jgi:TonB family protein
MLNVYRNTKRGTNPIMCYRSAMQQDALFSPLDRLMLSVSLALLSIAPQGSFAQDPAPAAPTAQASQSAPADPKTLMLQAAKLNGLTGDDVKPWHLKATWTRLDPDGKTTDQGTYEEWWVSPTKYKRTFTGNTLSVSEYGSEKGEMRTGEGQVLSTLLLNAQHDLAEPLPAVQTIQDEDFSIKEIDSNGAKLSCLSPAPQAYPGYTYCTDAGQSFLRVSVCAAESTQILHNRILRFQGHFIAGDLKIVHSGKTALTAHVVSIERLGTVNDADLTPPSDAVLEPRVVQIDGGVVGGMVLKKVAPEFPQPAKDMHVGGVVVLKAIINKEGHIRDLHVVKGPKILQDAALDAVRQWEYRPYLLNGEPVEVMTTINVVFALGN